MRYLLPDKRKHRGPHPEDERLFAESNWPTLRQAVQDFCWLLNRDYADKSALKLVGDHFALTQRQRMALMRCCCSDEARRQRRARQVSPENLPECLLLLDGYNVITTIEAALSGGVILKARDGCFRDLAGMHGTYRKVDETIPAVQLIGQYLDDIKIGPCRWYLDKPVSNSGRLKQLLREIAQQQSWNWQVELVFSPDGVLTRTPEIVATADSEILNRGPRWFNLAREIIEKYIPDANIIEIADDS